MIWWVYAVVGVLMLFTAPRLISAADTYAVLCGVLMLVLFAVWSWHLWISEVLGYIKKDWLQ